MSQGPSPLSFKAHQLSQFTVLIHHLLSPFRWPQLRHVHTCTHTNEYKPFWMLQWLKNKTQSLTQYTRCSYWSKEPNWLLFIFSHTVTIPILVSRPPIPFPLTHLCPSVTSLLSTTFLPLSYNPSLHSPSLQIPRVNPTETKVIPPSVLTHLPRTFSFLPYTVYNTPYTTPSVFDVHILLY